MRSYISVISLGLLMFTHVGVASAEKAPLNEKAFELYMFSKLLDVASSFCSSEIAGWRERNDGAFDRWKTLNAAGLAQGEKEVSQFYADASASGQLNSSIKSLEDLKAGPGKFEQQKLDGMKAKKELSQKYCGLVETRLAETEPTSI